MPVRGAVHQELRRYGFVRTGNYEKKTCRAVRKTDSEVVVLSVVVSCKPNGFCTVKCYEEAGEIFRDNRYLPSPEKVLGVIDAFLNARYSKLI